MKLRLNTDKPKYLSIHSIEDILSIGAPIIPENQEDRIYNLGIFKLLYNGDRELITKHYKEEFIEYGVFKPNTYNSMMIINNYCRQSTVDLINLATASLPLISADKSSDNKKISRWANENSIHKRLIEKVLINCHVSGNCFVHIIPQPDDEFNSFQVLDSGQVFVITDEITGAVTAYVAVNIYKDKNGKHGRYLVSEKGVDTVYNVRFNGNKISEIREVGSVNTGWDTFSIFNFVVNENLDFPEYGVSGYSDAVSLQSNITRALNTVSVIQEKYASPILTGPDIPDAHSNESSEVVGTMAGRTYSTLWLPDTIRNELELTGRYIANDSDKKIEYVEFKGNTDIYNEFIKKTLEPAIIKALGGMETLRQDSELPPDVDSSKALRLLYSQAINITERYCESVKGQLEKLCHIIAKMGKNTNVSIVFYPGMADFPDERAEYARGRMADGTFSKVDAIMYMDNVSEDDARKKCDKILADNEQYNINNEEVDING